MEPAYVIIETEKTHNKGSLQDGNAGKSEACLVQVRRPELEANGEDLSPRPKATNPSPGVQRAENLEFQCLKAGEGCSTPGRKETERERDGERERICLISAFLFPVMPTHTDSGSSSLSPQSTCQSLLETPSHSHLEIYFSSFLYISCPVKLTPEINHPDTLALTLGPPG